MIKRDVENVIRRLLKGFPIVTITGPRQSGKTTLARAIFSRKPYFSMEDPDVRQLALDDPRALLSQVPDGAVIDVIAEHGNKLMPIEIKSGQTLNRDFFIGLERWMALAGDQVISPTLVYGGTENTVRNGIRILNWRSAGQILNT
jgi:AAA+ ATPase superfamily predicted ATPase